MAAPNPIPKDAASPAEPGKGPYTPETPRSGGQPPSPPAPPPVTDLDELLQELKRKQGVEKAKQERLKQELEESVKETTAETTQITALEKASADVKQAVNAYKQVQGKSAQEAQELNDFSEQASAMLEPAIADEKKAIEEVISEFDQNLAEQEKEAAELEETQKTLTGELERAQQDEAQKKNALELAKGYAAAFGQKLTDAKKLKAELDKEYQQNDLAGMYFLNLELRKLLNDLKPISEADLQAQLKRAWSELRSAQETRAEKEASLLQTKEELAKARTSLASLRAERKSQILAKVREIKPTQGSAAK